MHTMPLAAAVEIARVGDYNLADRTDDQDVQVETSKNETILSSAVCVLLRWRCRDNFNFSFS